MDIGVKVIPFNQVMRDARRDLGLTQKELARRTGIHPSVIGGIERLCYPVNEVQATQIALELGVHVDDLFPAEARNFRHVKSRSIEFTMQVVSLDEVEEPVGLPDPAGEYELEERRAIVRSELDKLPFRLKRALELRYGFKDGHERTWEQVGEALGVTRERARQLIAEAVKSLQHPVHARRMR